MARPRRSRFAAKAGQGARVPDSQGAKVPECQGARVPECETVPVRKRRVAPWHFGTLAPWHLASGFTFIELLVVTTILLILSSAVMPLAKVTIQRQREAELRRALRDMRTAIDKYKEAVDNGLIGSIDVKAGSEGYPPDLDTLVEGVTVANDASGRKLKFLRRVPRDPISNSTEWGKRSYADKPDATTWGGSNVYDVYSKSDAKALDGTKYNEW